MWEPYYSSPAEPEPSPYGVRCRSPVEDTRVKARGGGTAEPGQIVRLGGGRLNAGGMQLEDLVRGKSSGELVTYVRSRDSELLSPRTRLRQRLARAGLLVNVESALVAKYASETQQRISPLAMEGKPLSQIVIEERER